MIFQLKHLFCLCAVLALSGSYLPGVIGRRDNERAQEFPKTLEEFGYGFNDEGKLRKINPDDGSITDEPFQFENQAHYNALGDAITEEVYQMMEDMGLHKIYIPANSDNPSFVFCTKTDLAFTQKLLILINGAGAVRAGQWARRLIINESLDHGTQLQYIRRAIELGYDVLVANTNNNYKTVNGTRIRLDGNGSPGTHITTVWNELIEPAIDTIQSFGVVAHSYGGCVTLQLAQNFPKQFLAKCFGVGFTDSVHSERGLSKTLLAWFSHNARNFVTSGRPLNTDLKSGPNKVPRFSSGHTTHEWTSWSCFDAMFPFLEEKYEEFAEGRDFDDSNESNDSNNSKELKDSDDSKSSDELW